MKNIFIALICILSVKNAVAQKDTLAFDEHNKYIYYQTADQPGLRKDTLYSRGLYFMHKAYPKGKLKITKADETQGVLNGEGSFVVSKRSLLSGSLGGEISYTLRIEVKDSKYRYWFTDFKFTPYKRDRYGMEVLDPGITFPMEEAKNKLEKRDVAVYLDKILAYSRQNGTVLKSYMLKIAPAKKTIQELKKISTKDW
jgi:hypothetical protein